MLYEVITEGELVARYGAMGRRFYRFARGEDTRRVEPDAPTKSISAETTFERDLSDGAALTRELWPLCETVARRLKRSDLAGRVITSYSIHYTKLYDPARQRSSRKRSRKSILPRAKAIP